MHTLRRRALALLLVTVAVGGALVTPPAQAASVASACPGGSVPVRTFRDVTSGAHLEAIDCLVWWGVTSGATSTTYAPGKAITREQIATMLGRLLQKTGDHPGVQESAGFVDVASDSPHKGNIDTLAALGIVTGANGYFRPRAEVSRGQMAAMLVRLLENVYTRALTPGNVFPDTVGNTHELNIAKLVGAGVTGGLTATTYGPGTSVTRAQMASFLMRSTNMLVLGGQAAPPLRGSASAYERLVLENGGVGRFDPCKPISYIINPAGAPSTGVADVKEAFRRVGLATGVTFSYEGTTTSKPTTTWGMSEESAYPGVWAPVIVGWGSPQTLPQLEPGPGNLGVGGPVYVTVGVENYLVSGAIAVNAPNTNKLPAGFGPGSQGAVLMHEIGHVVGLDHPSLGHEQVMYASLGDQPGLWGAGDRAGLGQVGLPQGCRPAPAAPWSTSMASGPADEAPTVIGSHPVTDHLAEDGHDDH